MPRAPWTRRPSRDGLPGQTPTVCGSTWKAGAGSSATPNLARGEYRSSSLRPTPSRAGWVRAGRAGWTVRTWAQMRRDPMDIDLSALRGLEAEKDISMDLAIKAIEEALLVAY